MNDLVLEQGSIIDRIDFNIDETLVHVEKGNEHLMHA
jgi:t-SNARE complex subunit (syntaxin)